MLFRSAALKLAASARAAEASLAVKSERPLVQVENSRYLLFLYALTAGHDLLDASGKPLAGWRTYWLPLKDAVRDAEDIRLGDTVDVAFSVQPR